MKKIAIIMCALIFMGVGCQQLKTETPKEEDVSFQQKTKCEELGRKYQKESETDENAVYLPHGYGYSKSRDTCLYIGGYEKNGVKSDYIIDLLTNATVARLDQNEKGEVLFGQDQLKYFTEEDRFKSEIMGTPKSEK
jgi:hypothetical protein